LVSTNSSLGLRTTNSSLALRLVRERQTANLESQSPSWLLADDDTMLESRLQSLLLHSPLLDGMFVAVPGTNASTRLSLDTIFVQSLNRTSLGAIVASGIALDLDLEDLMQRFRVMVQVNPTKRDYLLIPRTSLLSGRKLDRLLPHLL
jgi:hypothetical protein